MVQRLRPVRGDRRPPLALPGSPLSSLDENPEVSRVIMSQNLLSFGKIYFLLFTDYCLVLTFQCILPGSYPIRKMSAVLPVGRARLLL